MSFLGLSYQKFEYPGRSCSCRTLNYFPSYLPGYNCASAAKSSLSNNRMCNGSIQLLVSSVRRTRTPVNRPTVWGKVKEGGKCLGKIMPFSLTPLFTATWKKSLFSLLLIRWTLVKEKNNDTLVSMADIKVFPCTCLWTRTVKYPSVNSPWLFALPLCIRLYHNVFNCSVKMIFFHLRNYI